MNRITGLECHRWRVQQWGRVLTLMLLFCATTMLFADDAPPLASPDQLEDLLAPIALYPDPLLAVILPATTEPFDIVLAARFIRNHGDTNRISDQPWDASVKALAHYPGVVMWLDSNIEWTRTVGEAFRGQESDVMNAIQQLRAKASAAGNLSSTPQQKVITEGTDIRIVPAEPEIIYVPEYDPEIIYVERPSYYDGPLIWWGSGYHVGFWMSYDFDWHQRHIWVGDWRPGWTYRPSWGVPWRVNPYRRHDPFRPHWDHHEVPHTMPMPHAPVVRDRDGNATHGQRPGSMGRNGRPDVNGWGGVKTNTPQTPVRTTTPSTTPIVPRVEKKESVFGGIERGTTARDAADRGTISRQPVQPAAPVISPREVQPQVVPQRVTPQAPSIATPRFTPPAAEPRSFPQQAPAATPRFVPPAPVQRQPPPPARFIPPPAPPASVFGRSNEAGAARSNSQRGEQSRNDKKKP